MPPVPQSPRFAPTWSKRRDSLTRMATFWPHSTVKRRQMIKSAEG